MTENNRSNGEGQPLESKDTESNQLGTEKISTLFHKVVLPSMVAMVIIGVQSLIDGLFIGNYVGSDAMASVNLAMPFLQAISAIGMMISIGGTAFIGRLLGAGDEKTAQTVFQTSLRTLLVCGVVIVAIALILGGQIATALGASPLLHQDTTVYIMTATALFPCLLMYYLFSFVNRIIGKAHLFLLATIVCIVGNVALNYLFIVVLDWGVFGAGLATAISQTLGFLINLPPILSRKSQVNIYTGGFDWHLLGKVVYNGSSEGITSLATAVTTLVFNLTFMHYYQEQGVAAFTIIGYLSQVANLLIFGLVDGITPIVSYNYGAGQTRRVTQVIRISAVINFLIGVATYGVIYLWGGELVGMFADGDQALITLTAQGARLYGLMFFLCGFNILASSYYTAIGQAGKSMVVSSSRGLVFILVGVVTLPQIMDVTGVWLVAPFADLVTFVIVIALMLWKKAGNKNSP